MTNLVNKIKEDSITAMKEKNKAKLDTLRLLISELEKEKISQKLTEVTNLTDEQAISVINRQIKKLDKEIGAYLAVGRDIESQQIEKELLTAYLPKQMTEEEIRKEVKTIVNVVKVAGGNFGTAMKEASRFKGKANMKLVNQIVNELFKK